jgi:hypothetical protein
MISTSMRKKRNSAHHLMTMIATSQMRQVKVTEGCYSITTRVSLVTADMPPRTPKKHDEESVSSSKREVESPILKKAPVTLQLRSRDSCYFRPDYEYSFFAM